MPVGHNAHDVAPDEAEYDPVGHNVHDVAPDDAEYDPGGQTAQNGFL